MSSKVYRRARLHLDTSELFIRNAIGDPESKPEGNQTTWLADILQEIQALHDWINKYQPKILFCLGAFTYEFARRTLSEAPARPHAYWGAKTLGKDFLSRISRFDAGQTNLIPLLHATIARGKFIESHEYFCDQEGANYFKYTGNQIAQILLNHQNSLNIWIP